jgi:beta-glucosidase
MGMPGQEEGNAVADVIFGEDDSSPPVAISPGGHLPYTIPRVENEMNLSALQWPGVNEQGNYTERLQVGYRW